MAAGDLTTLHSAKQWLNLTTTDVADELLERLITAASQFIISLMDRQIASQNYTEIRDGHGGQALVFANYPVTAITLVKVSGKVIPPAADALNSGYRSNGKLLMLQGYQFTRGLGNVELAYTAGFAATPPELEQACLELMAVRYKERDHIGQEAASMQGQNVTFSTKDMPDSVKTIVQHWSKVVPV
jgi:uncharacterized phiE125 gp8 family phage protein